MINQIKKDRIIVFLEYFLVFSVLSLMFFFMIPQSDVFLFARATQGGFLNVLQNALYYGNRRRLGNIIGMFFSNYFELFFEPRKGKREGACRKSKPLK